MKTTPDIKNLLNQKCKATKALSTTLDKHRNPLYDRAQVETNSSTVTIRVFQVGVAPFADKELSKGIQSMRKAMAAQS